MVSKILLCRCAFKIRYFLFICVWKWVKTGKPHLYYYCYGYHYSVVVLWSLTSLSVPRRHIRLLIWHPRCPEHTTRWSVHLYKFLTYLQSIFKISFKEDRIGHAIGPIRTLQSSFLHIYCSFWPIVLVDRFWKRPIKNMYYLWKLYV